jgi:hypothetical protein
MAADSLQIAAKTAKVERQPGAGRPFQKGVSGNPAGRKRGSKNRATLAAQALLEGEVEALTRKAVELALGGDVAALRLCLSRVAAPRRAAPVELDLPALDTAGDAAAAMAAVVAATAEGAITPGEAFELSRAIDTALRALDARDAEQRRQALAEMARRPNPPQRGPFPWSPDPGSPPQSGAPE